MLVKNLFADVADDLMTDDTHDPLMYKVDADLKERDDAHG